MTKPVRLMTLWTLLGPFSWLTAESLTSTYPHAAAGTVGDIQIESSLTLLNTFDSPCLVAITYTGGADQAPAVNLETNGQTLGHTFTRTLTPGGAETLSIAPVPLAQGFFTFGIMISADCAGGPITQLAYTFFQNGQPTEIVSVSPGVDLGKDHCLRGHKDAGGDMGLAWLAPLALAPGSRLDLSLLDGDGNLLESQQRNTDGTHLALTLSEVFASIPAGDLLVEVCNPGEDDLVVQFLEFETGLSGSIQARELESRKHSRDCIPDATTACLHDGRFRVSVDWTPLGAATTPAQVSSQRESHSSFLLNDLDLGVGIVNNCRADGRFWVVHGGLSNSEFTLTVTDTQIPKTVTYESPLGIPALPVLDTGAFATCP